ncbi:MAG: alpha-2-macroglobulin, partial [Planctomycetota bacterium]
MTWKKILVLLLVAGVAAATISASPTETAARQKAEKAQKDGNWREAYEAYGKLALDPKSDPKLVGSDLTQATTCLERLNRMNEIDAFREAVIKVHAKNWRLLYAAAQNYINIQHWGFMVAGEFHRGQHRGGGEYVNAHERDRVRALQLMAAAMKAAEGEKDANEVASFHLAFANYLMNYRGSSQAWRLQYLSDLSKLPDYEPGYGYYYYRGSKGAPVNPDGTPVYHSTPKGWDGAKSDGERWRWLLLQAQELNPALTNQVR